MRKAAAGGDCHYNLARYSLVDAARPGQPDAVLSDAVSTRRLGRRQNAGAQDVWLTAKDGIRLNAWWFAKPDAEFATLFLHGNAGNVTHRIDHAHAIVMAGSAILVIDYRGYGKSNGHPGETGLYLDADAGYDELIRRGYSPGGFSCKASRLELPPLQNSRPDGRVPASFSNHPSLRCAGWPQRYFRLSVRCLCTGSIQKRRLRKSTRRCF